MTLYDLVFSDLCVAKNHKICWIKETPDSLDVLPIPENEAVLQEIEELYEAFETLKKSSFVHTWQKEKNRGFSMRVQRMETLSGVIYVCRRFMVNAKTLDEIGFPDQICQQLLSPALHDGLIVFCGKAGSGKTTAIYTFFKELLNTRGGVLWTLENPPEMRLEGRHGKGVCYQVAVDADEDMGALTPKFLRATPNYVFYGEIRDAATLKQAVKLSLSGHLVVTSIHAGDVVSCIARMGEFMDNDAGLLAESLRAVLYLELHQLQNVPNDVIKRREPTGTPPRVLAISPLFIEENNNEIKSTLRKKEYHMLGNTIEKRRNQYLNANMRNNKPEKGA